MLYVQLPYHRNRPTALVLIGLGLLGCGAGDAYYADDAEGTWYPSPTPMPESTPESTPAPEVPLPEETEDSFYRSLPASTARFVVIANPERHTLTKIDAQTQAVHTLPVGTHPTQVLTAPGEFNMAVVLNEGDSTVSVVDLISDELVDLPIHQDTNFLTISPDGNYAITTFDAKVDGANGNVDGARSYSSMTVIHTGLDGMSPKATDLTVGLNPRSVTFLPTEEKAIALCDQSLALIDLDEDPSAKLIYLSDDIDAFPQVVELAVSPDSRYVFLRVAGQSHLMVVDLQSEDSVFTLEFDGIPTDLDQSGDDILVVVRDSRKIYRVNALDPQAEMEVIETPENQLVGKIAVNNLGDAILYTTLSEADLQGTAFEDFPLNRFSVWDMSTDAIRVRQSVKPIESVQLNGNDDTPAALLIHSYHGESTQPAFEGEFSFSHFYFSDHLTAPVLIESSIKSTAHHPDSHMAYVILDGIREVLSINYDTRQVDGYALQSDPAFVGILADSSVGYISQNHDLGRLTFVDGEAGETQTITGFELNAQ